MDKPHGLSCSTVNHVISRQEQRGMWCLRHPCPSPPALASLQYARQWHGCYLTTTFLPLLSLAEDSSPVGTLPASSTQLKDNKELCAFTAKSCQRAADGLFPPDPVAAALQLVSHKDQPFLGDFLLPPPRWHTADWLTRPVIPLKETLWEADPPTGLGCTQHLDERAGCPQTCAACNAHHRAGVLAAGYSLFPLRAEILLPQKRLFGLQQKST